MKDYLIIVLISFNAYNLCYSADYYYKVLIRKFANYTNLY